MSDQNQESMEEESSEQQPAYTPEQLKEMRTSMMKHYEQQIPLLKKQKDYEVLLADIEEARARRMEMTIRLARMMAGPPPSPPQESDENKETQPEKKERKLRTETNDSRG